MKRMLAILLLLVTLMGWLQVAYGEAERACSCGEGCACKAETAGKPTQHHSCPCGCEKEKKKLESMPLIPVEWTTAMVAPEVHTPVPPVAYRDLRPEEAAMLRPVSGLRHAPPGSPPGVLYAPPAPYPGFHKPMRA